MYSFDSVVRYEQCPLLYKFLYIDKLPHAQQTVGSFLEERFMEILYRIYKGPEPEQVSLPDLRRYFLTSWAQKYISDRIIITPSERPEYYQELGLRAIESYFNKYHPFTQNKVVGLNKKVLVDLKGTGEYVLEGTIPLLTQASDGAYEIHEHRFDQELPDPEAFATEKELPFYQLALQPVLPRNSRVRLIWHYVLTDHVTEQEQSQVQLEALRSLLVSLVEKLGQAKEFPARVSDMCWACPYPEQCDHEKNYSHLKQMLVKESVATPPVIQ